jgi:hypothetical protein
MSNNVTLWAASHKSISLLGADNQYVAMRISEYCRQAAEFEVISRPPVRAGDIKWIDHSRMAFITET